MINLSFLSTCHFYLIDPDGGASHDQVSHDLFLLLSLLHPSPNPHWFYGIMSSHILLINLSLSSSACHFLLINLSLLIDGVRSDVSKGAFSVCELLLWIGCHHLSFLIRFLFW